MANFDHTQRLAGDYKKIPETERELENQLSGHNVKNKSSCKTERLNVEHFTLSCSSQIALIERVIVNKVGQ